MSKLLELEILFNEMIEPLDDAQTIVDVMIEGDIVEMGDKFKVQKLVGIIQMLLSNSYSKAVVFWDAIENDHRLEFLEKKKEQELRSIDSDNRT